jgi:hypothetical protein
VLVEDQFGFRREREDRDVTEMLRITLERTSDMDREL